MKIKLVVLNWIDRIVMFFCDCARRFARSPRPLAILPSQAPSIIKPRSAKESFLQFLKLSPVFSANPNFEKLIRDHIHLPPDSVQVDKNILTLSLGHVYTLHIDPNEPLTQDEFLRMNRHTDTENLIQLPDKCVNPMPAKLPELKLGNLEYFRSFGEIVTGCLQRYKKMNLGPEITLKIEGNILQFVKGGLMNICSIEFMPGWLEEKGLVSISSKMLFWTLNRLYFLSDVDWLLGKFK